MRIRYVLIGLLTFLLSTSNSWANDSSWTLLKGKKDGFPIIMKVMADRPPTELISRFGWLTVISWKYDRSENNGMPLAEINAQMVQLEDAIELIQERGLCVQVYSKTGNGLKELVYYISERGQFMSAFNEVLSGQPRYPLDIEFFEDPVWGDLETVQKNYLNKDWSE